MPIVIQILPNDPSQVNAFVRLNQTPTVMDYDWFLTSSNGTDNYTLYVPAELTIGVDQMFVGVQSFTGIFSCQFHCVKSFSFVKYVLY